MVDCRQSDHSPRTACKPIRWQAALLTIVASGLPPAIAGAQGVQPAEMLPPIGTYNEVYLDNPKVSGNNLVGLRWSSSEKHFDPNSIHVRVTNASAIGLVCVEIISKDGRYTSENTYDLTKSKAVAPGFQSHTRYPDKLTGYSSDDVSVIVSKAPCEAAQIRPIIPAFLNGDRSSRPSNTELRAFVNADPARVSIAIIGPDKSQVASGTCSPAGGGVQIAYSAECSITMPPTLQGQVLLHLSQKERFKTVSTDYPVLLP